jgi:hypothetical protein
VPLWRHFVHLKQWEYSCMLTTLPVETQWTSLIPKGYYSGWKGKMLLNKWGLMTCLKISNASWAWQWK